MFNYDIVLKWLFKSELNSREVRIIFPSWVPFQNWVLKIIFTLILKYKNHRPAKQLTWIACLFCHVHDTRAQILSHWRKLQCPAVFPSLPMWKSWSRMLKSQWQQKDKNKHKHHTKIEKHIQMRKFPRWTELSLVSHHSWTYF